jgi:hypothetical protein
MSGRFAQGGFVPGPPATVNMKARTVGGRTEYWEPSIGAWVPVWTAAEIEEIGGAALQSLREAQARADHG